MAEQISHEITDIPERGVVIKGIKKIFGETTLVLEKIDLEIVDKEFLILVGPSGCGKSTLLRIIAGLEFPTDGDIFINGKWVNRIPPRDRNIAFVFQSYALYPHMTVRDNMSFSLRLKKMNKGEINEKVDNAADILGIESQLSKKPVQLSGGQRQRVALGRAIVRDPDVFLLDEPLSNLDAKLRADMRSELVRLQRKLGKTMIYVTHDQVEAMTMGDRIVILNDGKIQQVGTPIEVYEEPANKFVSGFIGTPSMNYIGAKLDSKNKKLLLENNIGSLSIDENLLAKIKGTASSDELILGIRPEDIHLNDSTDSILCNIDVVEPLGAQTHVSVNINEETTITMIINGLFIEKEGTEKKISFNLEKLHIFDGKTEKAILHGLK